jgi:hypothetical protein
MPALIASVLLSSFAAAVADAAVAGDAAAGTASAGAPAHQASFEYVSPWPGARFTDADAPLIFRPRAALGSGWTDRLVIRGDVSGNVTGRWIASADGVTRIFRPDSPFAPGETVTVSFAAGSAEAWSHSFRVVVRHPATIPDFVTEELEAAAADRSTFRGSAAGPFPLPADLPPATVTRFADPTPGSIFASNLMRQGAFGAPYLMILDNRGFPEFFRRMPGNCLDFKLQPTGVLSYNLRASRRFYLMDPSYAVIDSVSGGNGEWLDGHELRLLPDGHAVVMIYEARTMDLTSVVSGGRPDAGVVGLMVQELDSARNVVFQWSSFDWMDVTDAADDVDLTSSHIDWTHGNAIEVEDNGDFIVSCRNTDEIAKISRATGELVWRFGGKRNQFTFTNETRGFRHQHAIRRLRDGNVILFDNGNGVGDSRAVEYHLDEENLTATTVWEHHHDPPVDAEFMGYAQRLQNGNTFISWGTGGPLFSEVTPAGDVALEMELPPGVFSYRTVRHHWNGAASAPTLWTVEDGRRTTLVFARFGEQTVNRFRVYGGPSPEPTTEIGSTEVHTFELPGLGGRTMYFRVTEVERNGAEGPYSNEVMVAPIPPDHEEVPGPDDPRGGAVALLRNAPNPFRSSTEIGAVLPPGEAATVRIFNVLGQEVRTLRMPAADAARVRWDGLDAAGRPAPAGVYLYRLEAPGVTETRRMVRVR